MSDRTFMPLVYICCPESGGREMAARCCRLALDRGQIPLAPGLMFPEFMYGTSPAERDLAAFMRCVLLGKCDELWVFGSAPDELMEADVGVAERRRQTIRYFREDES